MKTGHKRSLSSKGTRAAPRRGLVARGISALARVSPGAAERLVLRLFMTPTKLARRAPELSGVLGREVTLRSAPYRLRVWEWGDGPSVLLVHGWSGQAIQWEPFAEALVRTGHRVVAVDLPAHGLSSGKRTTLPDLVRAVRTAGCYAGPLHAVIGHSLGATASTLALAAGLDVRRMVAIAPPRDPIHFVKRLADWVSLPASRFDSLLRRLERRAGVRVADLDLRSVAPLLETPVLILHSKGDREVPFLHGTEIAQAWPGAQLIALEGGSHTKILQQPDVIDAALAFIGEEGRSATAARSTQMADHRDAILDDGDRFAYRAAL